MAEQSRAGGVGPGHRAPVSTRRQVLTWLLAGAGALGLAGAVGQDAYDWAKSKVFPPQEQEPPAPSEAPIDGPTFEVSLTDGGLEAGWFGVLPANVDTPTPEALETCQGAFDFVQAKGGADAGSSRYLVTMIAGKTPLAVTAIRAKVLARQEPLSGPMLSCMAEGAVDTIAIAFRLEEDNPSAQAYDQGFEEWQGPYFNSHTINLAENESQRFDVTGIATDTVVTWQLEITARFGPQEQVFLVPDEKDAWRTGPAWSSNLQESIYPHYAQPGPAERFGTIEAFLEESGYA